MHPGNAKNEPGPFSREGWLKNDCQCGMRKESTAWDVYNNEARKVDIELVNDWRETLNSLLLFTGIFAAVLGSFIIESKKMLEPNPTELLGQIMPFSVNNNGNASNLPFVPTPFEPTSGALAINCLLFASLGVTLIAALASVVALQWVADYDSATTREGSSPEDRAKRRQFRFEGVIGWKMGEIIAVLQLLLYFSVILFWLGATQWMRSTHPTVGFILTLAGFISATMYLTTTFLAAGYVSAPFHTPLSRGLYWLLSPSIAMMRHSISKIYTKTSVWWPSMACSKIRSCFWTHLAQVASIIPIPVVSLRLNSLPRLTSRQRENEAARLDPTLEPKALGWLAQQLPISESNHKKLLLLVTEALRSSADFSIALPYLEEPWTEIFNFLGWHYMRQIIDGTITEANYEAVGILVRCSTAPGPQCVLSPSSNYERDPAKSAYWHQSCFGTVGIKHHKVEASENWTFLLGRDVPIPSSSSKHELESTIELIRWRNSTGTKGPGVWKKVFEKADLYSKEYIDACIRCFRLWLVSPKEKGIQEEILEMATAYYMESIEDSNTRFQPRRST